jgi:uncharacterized protein YaaR (DUF327 family)
MLRFAFGMALGIAGYKSYLKKKENDPEFKEKMEKIENKISENWENLNKTINDKFFKNAIEELSEYIKKENLSSEQEKEFESILNNDFNDIRKTWSLLVFYIKILID